MPPDKDYDLLARLNALKPSPVSLFASASVSPTAPIEDADDLTARFRALHGTRASVEPEETPHNEEDERTLEELLEGLGPENGWLDPEDEGNVEGLLREARGALDAEGAHDNRAGAGTSTEGKQVDGGEEEGVPVGKTRFEEFEARLKEEEKEDDGRQDGEDEKDAEEYIARVLAELDIEGKEYDGDEGEEHGEKEESAAAGEERRGDGLSLDLPSAPSELPSSPVAASEGDDALSARFAKLGLALPATPTFSPSKKPPKIVSGVKKSNLPTYTDEDIESWCCICNEDATVKCLGCDGDLYCSDCWNDGHGKGPGQERGHRAVEYRRDDGITAA
ncbi:hypothetical protein CAC42_2852 [Sphaceloma murrayae]|uniref:Zinc finger FYVE domain-containing protein 19 n=1 Tax=Sphaceloma murrayae TaxID=2082308 RepID=A0A2K1R0U2_9PEZI|nr:hypothetical protein CAC42_2852 [Sphaceloma murrayae]